MSPIERLSSRYSAQRGGMSRILEDLAFLVGVFLIGTKGVVEILQEASVIPYHDHTVASIVVEFGRSTVLVVPKMIGKATAGRAWTALGERFGKRSTEGDQ